MYEQRDDEYTHVCACGLEIQLHSSRIHMHFNLFSVGKIALTYFLYNVQCGVF